MASCIKMDFFLFDSEPASLEDYDFTSENLDGIPADRITSELIPSQQPGKDIHVIFVERDEAEIDPRIDPDRRVTVLFSHGNRSNMLLYWYRVGYFEDMGFNVLMYDYRGYGASDGETTERHVYEDAETAYDYLAARDDVGDIVSVGYSMGGAPAIWLCSPESGRQVLGCFTEAAFASTDKLIDDGTGYDFEQSWFVDVEFDNETRIKTIFLPFLIMHGTKDQRVGFENGQILWSAVKDNNPLNTFYVIEGANHRNIPVPSYKGSDEPREYSHPDELPPLLAEDFEIYKSRIVEFVVSALQH
jgi:fermentation-respiration switch protein FrsA (DUF1100 family)